MWLLFSYCIPTYIQPPMSTRRRRRRHECSYRVEEKWVNLNLLPSVDIHLIGSAAQRNTAIMCSNGRQCIEQFHLWRYYITHVSFHHSASQSLGHLPVNVIWGAPLHVSISRTQTDWVQQPEWQEFRLYLTPIVQLFDLIGDVKDGEIRNESRLQLDNGIHIPMRSQLDLNVMMPDALILLLPPLYLMASSAGALYL